MPTIYVFAVIILCEYEVIRPFMIRACYLGMCNGDYFFVYPWLLTPAADEWQNGDEYDVIAKEAFKYLIWVALALNLCHFYKFTPYQ